MKVRVVTIVGLSFLWTLLYSDIYFPLSLTFHDGVAFSQERISYFHTLFCIVLACVLAIGFLARRSVPFLVQGHPRRFGALAAVIGVLGAVVLVVAPAQEGWAVQIGAATALLAVWFALVLLGWASALVGRSEGAIAQDVLLSFVVHLGSLFVALVLGIPMALFSLVSVAGASLALVFVPAEKARQRFGGVQAFAELPLKIVVPLAFFVLLGVVSTRLMVGAANGIPTDESRFMTVAFSFAIAVVMLIWCFVRPWTPDLEFSIFSFLAVAAVFGFVSIILLNQYELPFSTKRIAVASEHCQEVFCFIVLVTAAARKRLSPLVPAMVFLVVCFIVPRFIANDLVFFLGSGLSFDAADSMAAVAATVIFAFTVLLVVLLMRQGRSYREGMRDDEGAQLLDRCERLSRMGGLSKRETETMVCLCEGMSVKDAADAMCIAESTVKTHVKHIYEKLDVHSRRDLASLVEGYGADEAR